MLLWTVLIIIISFIIIIISILTAGDSKTFSGALVGSTDLDLFQESKERGTKKWLSRAMFLFGILLMIVAVVMKVYI